MPFYHRIERKEGWRRCVFGSKAKNDGLRFFDFFGHPPMTISYYTTIVEGKTRLFFEFREKTLNDLSQTRIGR